MRRIEHVIFSVDVQLPRTKDRVSTQYKRAEGLDIQLTNDIPGGGVLLIEGEASCIVPMVNVRRLVLTPEEPAKVQAVRR